MWALGPWSSCTRIVRSTRHVEMISNAFRSFSLVKLQDLKLENVMVDVESKSKSPLRVYGG